VQLRFLAVFVIIAVALASSTLEQPKPAIASAQPVCPGPMITRTGTLRTIYTQTNGGYTSFASSGGGTYGVDPNSIPEELMNLLKPNGPSIRATVAGRACVDRIFYIERVDKPIRTSLRPYTP
jgi:hypothetical protein